MRHWGLVHAALVIAVAGLALLTYRIMDPRRGTERRLYRRQRALYHVLLAVKGLLVLAALVHARALLGMLWCFATAKPSRRARCTT